jgi:molybdopterin-guanine dinucleotide biosynthesis protein A
MSAVLGVFVGGRSTRMGGHPKGLLAAPDTGEALVVRAVRLARELGATPVLVGDARAYDVLGCDVPAVCDDPPDVGPLGGLCGLLGFAGDRAAFALACDMPFVTLDHLRALAVAHPGAPCVAARRSNDAPWEPFFARYDAPRVLPAVRAMIAAGERSLQRVMARVGARALSLDARATDDWDTPDDVSRCRTL